MIIFIILGVVVILAFGVVGFLFFILRKEASNDAVAVPISNLGEMNRGGALQVPEGALEDQIALKMQLQEEYAAKETVYQQKVQEVENELHAIDQKAKQQSEEALLTIEQLKKENEENLSKAQDTVHTLQNDQSLLQVRLEESQANVQKLQDEAVFFRQQMTQEITQAKAQVEQVAAENRSLKTSIEAMKLDNTKDLQPQLDLLAQENQELKKAQSQLELENQTFKNAQQELLIYKSQVEQLAVENQALKIAIDNAREDTAKESLAQIEALKQGTLKLQEENEGLLSEKKKLLVSNEELSKNSDALQWEMTKARAQMTSFERACENYQLQLKEALESKKSTDENHGQLSEDKGHLQTELIQLKQEKEDLLKRQRLFESQFEKHRQQIVVLEQECEHLKAEMNKGQTI